MFRRTELGARTVKLRCATGGWVGRHGRHAGGASLDCKQGKRPRTPLRGDLVHKTDRLSSQVRASSCSELGIGNVRLFGLADTGRPTPGHGRSFPFRGTVVHGRRMLTMALVAFCDGGFVRDPGDRLEAVMLCLSSDRRPIAAASRLTAYRERRHRPPHRSAASLADRGPPWKRQTASVLSVDQHQFRDALPGPGRDVRPSQANGRTGQRCKAAIAGDIPQRGGPSSLRPARSDDLRP